MDKAKVILKEREDAYVGSSDKKPNVATFWYEGTRYDIAYGKVVEIPLGLAVNLNREKKLTFFEEI